MNKFVLSTNEDPSQLVNTLRHTYTHTDRQTDSQADIHCSSSYAGTKRCCRYKCTLMTFQVPMHHLGQPNKIPQWLMKLHYSMPFLLHPLVVTRPTGYTGTH